MNEKPHIMAVKVTATLLSIALLITVMACVPKFAPETAQALAQPEYIDKVFDKNTVNEISIDMDESDFQWIMDNATKEEFKSCNITINGEKFYNVGIRPKGNSSLSNLARSSETQRFSLKIDFDQYVNGQKYHGMEGLVLNNVMSDKSYMKEYLSFELFDFMGIASSSCAYSNIKINNKDWGLYLAVELVDESFIQRKFGSVEGNLYKPEGMDMGGAGNQNGGGPPDFGNFKGGQMPLPKGNNGDQMDGKIGAQDVQKPASEVIEPQNGLIKGNDQSKTDKQSGQDKQNTQNDQNIKTDSKSSGNQKRDMKIAGGFGGMGARGGTNLKYTDDNPESYSVVREGAVFKSTTDEDFKRVIEMIKNLNNGTELEKYLDVDEILRFWAVNTFLVNLDSYAGGMYHNYYLYEEDGLFTLLPWDFNMSFAGFSMKNASNAINFPIDKPVTGNLEDAPLIGKLLEVDEYKTRYHDYLKKIVEEYVGSGIYEKSINSVNALISDYVKKDATAFYTFEEYQKAIPAMKTFGKDRAASIIAQLDGTQPSTAYGTISTTLNLNDLGSMDFGGFGGNGNSEKKQGQQGGVQPQGDMQGGNMQPPDGMQPPGDMQEGNMQPPDGMQPPGDMQGGNMQPPDGMQTPGDMQQGGNMQLPGDLPQLENMNEVMQVIDEANGTELTDTQKEKLKSLGVDENMLKQILSMSKNMGFPGGQNSQNTTGMMKAQIVILLASVAVLLAGIIFVTRFRRKSYIICNKNLRGI